MVEERKTMFINIADPHTRELIWCTDIPSKVHWGDAEVDETL